MRTGGWNQCCGGELRCGAWTAVFRRPQRRLWCPLLQPLSCQKLERLCILPRGGLYDLRRQLGSRRFLVPLDGEKVVTHKLFVEARLRSAGSIRGRRPEARRIGGERLVDPYHL